MIKKNTLVELYLRQKLSVKETAQQLRVSQGTVHWWMQKYKITKRSRSEALYIKNNKSGDPFAMVPINTIERAQLYGYGSGLYWGEGTKADRNSVRLGNTDANLLNMFIEFLTVIFQVDRSRLKVYLQLFNDIDVDEAESYWQQKLGLDPSQFGKSTISLQGSVGSYRRKSKYGVATVYFCNTKLRNLLVDSLPSDGVKYVEVN